MKRISAVAGVSVAAILLLVGACGGDDTDADDAAVAAPDAGDASEEEVPDDTDIDPCTLLEVAEIEAEFGDAGTVLDGEREFDMCTWEVGEDQSQLGTGTVHVFTQYVDPSLPIEDAADIFAEQQATTPEAVEIEGLGDAAYFTPNAASVDFLLGDTILFVQAVFIPERDGVQDSLETLAHLVAERF